MAVAVAAAVTMAVAVPVTGTDHSAKVRGLLIGYESDIPKPGRVHPTNLMPIRLALDKTNHTKPPGKRTTHVSPGRKPRQGGIKKKAGGGG